MYWIGALLFVVIVIFLLFSFYPAIGSGRRVLPSGKMIDRLRTTAILEPGDGRKIFCDSILERRAGLYVLRLKGSPYEMGFQHGVLLREEIRRGAVLYHAGSIDNFTPFNQKPDSVRWLLKRYYDWTIYRLLFRNAPEDYLAELKGLADGCGLPFDIVFRGNMLSEFNMNMAKLTKRGMLKRLQGNECTSFAAYGSHTPDGKLVMGRNTDYPGAGLWDKYQTVVFYEPEDGHRFVNVGTAGLLKCNSCMNEKGLCLGGHFLYADDVKANGVGFTALELEIMKKAGSIEEAHAIVEKYSRAGAFAYLLADGSRNEAAVLEACANHVGLRLSEDGRICETNFMTTEELKPVDIMINQGVGRNPLARYRRMLELIDENSGSITPQKAAVFMGDHKDVCSNSVRPFGMCPATLGNLTSVVFYPESFDFWVADGLAPVCNNLFIGFNLMSELLEGRSFVEPEILEGNNYGRTASFEALRKYYDIRVKATIPPVVTDSLLGDLEDVIKKIPGEVAYRVIAAKLSLRRGDVERAKTHLKMARGGALSENERAQVSLLIGFAQDLQGARQDALENYQEVLSFARDEYDDVLNAVNPFILVDAKKHINSPFSLSHAEKLEVNFDMMSQYDI